MVKLLTFICIISYLAPVQAEQTLLKCLGKEELVIHKTKMSGPVYRLNQYFINEMSRASELKLRPQSLQKICKGRHSPSVELLFLLLLEGQNIFRFSQWKEDDPTVALMQQKSAISSIFDELPHIFFNYLSSLQAIAPKAKCLEREIPEIAYFIERIKYLEVEVAQTQLLREKDKIKRIFGRLQDLDDILRSCR